MKISDKSKVRNGNSIAHRLPKYNPPINARAVTGVMLGACGRIRMVTPKKISKQAEMIRVFPLIVLQLWFLKIPLDYVAVL